MNIRNVWRLCFVSVASLFWASCGSDSSTQATENNDPESPESSSAAPASSEQSQTSSSSQESDPVSSETQSLSSAEVGSSSSVNEPGSSESLESSSSESESSSSEASSSSSLEQFVLAKDPSVTCTKFDTYESVCGSTTSSKLSCMDLQEFLKADTAVHFSTRMEWERKLENCGAIEEAVALYGIVYDPCNSYRTVTNLKCSDGLTYKWFKVEDGVAYTSEEEYNKAKGISSSSEVESSSSEAESSSSSLPEGYVQCSEDGFALFADILAEVQKEIYQRISELLENPESGLTDAQKRFYDGLLDSENEKLLGNFSPYYMGVEDLDVKYTSLKYTTDLWFDGYIAKTYTCAGGTLTTNERYQEKYDKILEECLDIINKSLPKK